ncbi:uncharacterized protein JCM15063_003991 [Sporobolomyces koalae]|uniref:uncharacterized protein n=1 Tax=Sporobolomyces koalae TaxID=500713 RepID=UPI00316DC3C4
MADAQRPDEQPWHAAFPTPTSSLKDGTLVSITVDELQKKIRDQPTLDKRDFLVVDVRRTDFDTGFIRGAINLPAQSFYATLETLLPLLYQYKLVIFHCQSSNGRGPRVAGWYQDALDEFDISRSRGAVLEGGIKKWIEVVGLEAKETVKL